jgi:hypothetical protein
MVYIKQVRSRNVGNTNPKHMLDGLLLRLQIRATTRDVMSKQYIRGACAKGGQDTFKVLKLMIAVKHVPYSHANANVLHTLVPSWAGWLPSAWPSKLSKPVNDT